MAEEVGPLALSAGQDFFDQGVKIPELFFGQAGAELDGRGIASGDDSVGGKPTFCPLFLQNPAITVPPAIRSGG